MKRALKHKNAGMTLIEVVVVALLLSILSAILYGTLNGIMRARESTETVRTVDQTAHYVFSRLTMELASRSFIPLNTGTDDKQNSGSSPVPQAPAYLRGVDKKNGEHEQDSIRFVSASAAQPLIGAPSNFGLTEVEYRLEENPDAPTEMGEQKVLTLVRDEQPAGTNSADISKKRRVVLPLADNVVSLNFRYFKKDKWQDEWKDSTPPLPEVIEISLELARNDGKTEFYRTAVPISAKQKQP